MEIKKILVATDFSESAAGAAVAAVELARRYDAKVEIVHAYSINVSYSPPAFTGVAPFPDGFFDDMRKAATDRVEAFKEELGADDVVVEARAVAGTDWMTIVEEAERTNTDLIVMGTRGLTGVKHAVLGSVAERTVRHAQCSVLTVKHAE